MVKNLLADGGDALHESDAWVGKISRRRKW